MSAVLRSLDAQSRAMSSMIRPRDEDSLDPLGEMDQSPFHAAPRGAAALEKWRRSLLAHPELVTERIRRNRNFVLGSAAALPGPSCTMRGYFSQEVPFGKARTAAYLLFGIADVCDLMEAGHWKLAEAHVHLLLASGEQAAIHNWEWPLAWLLTQLPDPPFGRIQHTPVAETARPLSRLADQGLMNAVLSFYKDVSTVMEAQKKTAPNKAAGGGGGDRVPPKKKGDGKGKAKASAAQPPEEGA